MQLIKFHKKNKNMAEITTFLSAAKTLDTIIDENKRNKIIKQLKIFFRDKRKIIVFGISGTGKSQFINSLTKSLKIPERTLINKDIYYELEDFPIIFIDTPGQEVKNPERIKKV